MATARRVAVTERHGFFPRVPRERIWRKYPKVLNPGAALGHNRRSCFDGSAWELGSGCPPIRLGGMMTNQTALDVIKMVCPEASDSAEVRPNQFSLRTIFVATFAFAIAFAVGRVVGWAPTAALVVAILFAVISVPILYWFGLKSGLVLLAAFLVAMPIGYFTQYRLNPLLVAPTIWLLYGCYRITQLPSEEDTDASHPR
jgi:hypothetical protein